jgi:hypothetical protein
MDLEQSISAVSSAACHPAHYGSEDKGGGAVAQYASTFVYPIETFLRKVRWRQRVVHLFHPRSCVPHLGRPGSAELEGAIFRFK